jgi:molecular chaperone IbpA
MAIFGMPVTISLNLKKENNMRTSHDFTPLYRSAVGFDRLVNLLDSAARSDTTPGFPPYNIERIKGEDESETYRIEIAVAGFKREQLSIEFKENLLTVTGRKETDDGQRQFLHRGLAERSFERRFQVADHIRVLSADLVDGLLSISLRREIPEALKPRQIPIGTVLEPLTTE